MTKEEKKLMLYLKKNFYDPKKRLEWLDRDHPYILGYKIIKPIDLIRQNKYSEILALFKSMERI